jgi:hypothetical protein
MRRPHKPSQLRIDGMSFGVKEPYKTSLANNLAASEPNRCPEQCRAADTTKRMLLMAFFHKLNVTS